MKARHPCSFLILPMILSLWRLHQLCRRWLTQRNKVPWNPHLNPPNRRRPIGPARSILLVVTGGKSSDGAAVWEHGGADRCAAAADWIGAAAGKRIGRNQGKTERCRRNRFKIRQLLVFLYPEGARLAPSWAAGVAWHGKDEKKYERTRLGVGCLASRMPKSKSQNNSKLPIPRRGDADGNQASLAYRRWRSCCHPFSNRVRSTSRTGSDGISVERAGHLR